MSHNFEKFFAYALTFSFILLQGKILILPSLLPEMKGFLHTFWSFIHDVRRFVMTLFMPMVFNISKNGHISQKKWWFHLSVTSIVELLTWNWFLQKISVVPNIFLKIIQTWKDGDCMLRISLIRSNSKLF